MGSLAINIDRLWNDIETLATFSAGNEGVNRLTFSDEDRAARAYLRAQMVSVGFEVVEIPPGIMLGRLNPLSSSGPAVMSGSHIDAVPAAGRFDGIVGVVGALEVGRVLAEQRVALKHPYEVVIYPEEEGTRFGAVLTGSKAWVGELSPQQLAAMHDRAGTSYLAAMETYGLRAADLERQRFQPGRAKAILELHIEQSVVLEECGVQIGVVTTITGIRSFEVTLTGSCEPCRCHADGSSVRCSCRGSGDHAGAGTLGTDIGSSYRLYGGPNFLPPWGPQRHSGRGAVQHRFPRCRRARCQVEPGRTPGASDCQRSPLGHGATSDVLKRACGVVADHPGLTGADL